MTALLRQTILQPMNLPALLTWLAVALSLRYASNGTSPVLWLAMLMFAAAFLAHDFLSAHRVYSRAALFALETASALTVCWFASRGGAAPALLVVMIAHMAMVYPRRVVIVLAMAINLALYAILVHAHSAAPLVITLIFAGFQSFAALIARYARSAEQTRDQLALVNADLLATRALLADSARDAERLRMARELHDVAGHKLTAMMLNLRALAAEPDLAERREVQLAQQLAGELLGDIRGVVQALRDARGLDLATALRALAAPMPKPALDLAIDADIHLTDPALAETLLRVVQEALTNSARHAEAERVVVDIRRDGATLRMRIEDDGQARGPLREGNGLAGMRERIDAAGGTLALSRNRHGAMRIDASFPLNPARPA
ncbi:MULTISPECIES: histidine kinase [unclassified Lysobacter]|uniref:sensor histidine kinase n=1 Tax=unclassified Lysobacter TaxID=2635362 RepID=UPI001BE913E7|nr:MULTISPECIES: histidine kinase [unclassified Lysobacter]MBT2750210.1 sensor histidine kinase [Lysobacter sp. ISL-50]MBT2775219.1 sensor histidine kinase [Lysobacter sp. ISL-54]MBT2782592.1 sensor histidine kinase [Lysobacter sp. ISL-52]